MPELFVESAVNESAARFSNKVKYVFLHSLFSRNEDTGYLDIEQEGCLTS